MNLTVLYPNFPNIPCFQPHSVTSAQLLLSYLNMLEFCSVMCLASCHLLPPQVTRFLLSAMLNQLPPVHLLFSFYVLITLLLWSLLLFLSLLVCVFRFLHYHFAGFEEGRGIHLRAYLLFLTRSPMLYSCVAVILES